MGTGCFFKNLLESYILVFFKTYFRQNVSYVVLEMINGLFSFYDFLISSRPSIAPNFGVPKPVTGSQPLVHWKPYLEGYPVSSFKLSPTVTSVKATGWNK